MSENVFSNNKIDSTDWEIKPSFKYDVLCFINILTADKFYLTYYQSDFDKYKDKFTPQIEEALRSLKKKVKDDKGKIISAWLCLYFSATDDETIDDLLLTLDNPAKLKDSFLMTPYYSDDDWSLFDSVRNELKNILEFLRETNFAEYWKASVLPVIKARITEFMKDIDKFNIIKYVEENLGFKLPSNKITVYLLFYSRPHGIKITGTRFLSDAAWPFEILVRTASHEMMHPPFDLKNDTVLTSALTKLKPENFFMEKVLNHNPSFGYNTFEGFVEEDCVQALDQIINEKLGIASDAGKRWKQSDDGMHVLAVALYNIMKAEKYNDKKEMFRDFLIRNIDNGKLLNGNIEKIYKDFYSI